MSKTKSIALIGVSGYAGVILRGLRNVMRPGECKLVAAVVINREEEAQTCRDLEAGGCQIYDDYPTMLREWSGRLDLCVIPTSIHWHKPMTLDALAAGANVLVEKPLAGSPEEGRAIMAAAQDAGKFVAVGFQDLYKESTWEIKDWLRSEQGGAIESIQVTASWPRDKTYYTRNDWAGRLQCQGRPVFDSPLNNAYAHFVNLALFLAGRERHEMARIRQVTGNLWRFYPIETFDTACVRLISEQGVPIRVVMTHADSVEKEPQITIRLRKGELVWVYDQSATFRGLDGHIVRQWRLRTGDEKREEMLRNVLSSLITGQAPSCPASLAMRHLEVIAQLHEKLDIEEGGSAFPELESSRNDPWESVPGLFQRLLAVPSELQIQ